MPYDGEEAGGQTADVTAEVVAAKYGYSRSGSSQQRSEIAAQSLSSGRGSESRICRDSGRRWGAGMPRKGATPFIYAADRAARTGSAAVA